MKIDQIFPNRETAGRFHSDSLRLDPDSIAAWASLAALQRLHGTLPDDDAAIARLLRYNIRRWRRIKPLLLRYGLLEPTFQPARAA